MNVREDARLTAQMTAEERARLVAALDHDLRQPRHSMEMGLRTLRLLTADLRTRRFDDATFDSLLQRQTVELASLQAAWDLRDGGIMLMYADPLLATLHGTDGYLALAKSVGFA